MKLYDQNLIGFLEERRRHLLKSESKGVELADLDKNPLAHDQAIYVVDFVDKKIIYQRGVKELLGYSEEEFTPELVSHYFHEEDKARMQMIIKASILFATTNALSNENSKLFLNSRIRKKDGTYVHALRQTSIFQSNEKGEMTANISLLSRIDFIPFTGVQYKLDADGQSILIFDEMIKKVNQGLFTKREQELLELLKIGLSSSEIADKLFISKNTVDTHRRNMLKKTACRNSMELLEFYRAHYK